MNGPVKRTRIFAHLKNLKSDIMFLQETQKAEQNRLRKPWIGQMYHSNFDTRARGVAILVSKKNLFTSSNVVSDLGGKYVIVTGTLFQVPVLLVNVYAPNWDNIEFMNKVFSLIPNLNTHRLIFGGDLNCVVDPLLDRSSSRLSPLSKMSKALSSFMTNNGCIDPWRYNHFFFLFLFLTCTSYILSYRLFFY